MNYLGDYAVNSTVRVYFDTFGTNGESLTMSGLAVGDIKIYRTNTTERASTNGISLMDTDGTDFDARTGIHGFTIDLSDNSDAGFYAAGNEYTVVVDSITVNAQTVRFIAASFSIERAGGALALLKDATSGLSALKTLIDTIDDFLDTEVAAIKAKTDNLPADPADASDIAASHASLSTKLDTIDDFLDTEVAAIKAKTDNLPADPADASDIAASFASLNTKVDTIDDFLDTEVAAIKAKTDNLPADPADASDIAALITAVDDFVDTEVAAIKAVTDKVDTALELDGAVYRFTTNALEQSPAGGGADSFELLTGTAQSGTASSIRLEAGAPTGTDRYKRCVVFIKSGTGAGQSSIATAYDGATKDLSVAPDFDIVPDNTSVYVVAPGGYDSATIEALVAAIWAALRADHQIVGSMGEGVNARLTAIAEDTNAPSLLKDVLDGTTLLGVDVQKNNGAEVTGSGTDADPWSVAVP